MDDTNVKGVEKTKEKIGHRRVTEEGTVTYKRKPTTELQKAIQLGIEVCVSSTQQKPKRDVLLKDFGEIETLEFPKEGSSTLPAHNLGDFKFRNFAPVAFRFFRDIYQVNAVDFLNSLCGHDLRELSNAGASGSVFYISHDDEFIIKTVQHKEADFLQKLLPEYFMNLTQHPRTLLPKFYGLYCYQSLGKNIRIVVMNNLIPSSIKIHEKYDLKGSTYKRYANNAEKAKSSPTLKDLDFREIHPEGLLLETETYDALTSTIARDCRVLESFRIMDYSLLLAVHNLDEMKREKIRNKIPEEGDVSNSPEKQQPSVDFQTSGTAPNNSAIGGTSSSQSIPNLQSTRPSPPATTAHSTALSYDSQPQKKFSAPAVWHRTVKRIAAFSTALESIQANVEPVQLDQDELKSVPPGGIPARNGKGDRLLLFVGIIDILQSYRLTKKMEHTFKSIFHDGDTISVHNPAFYATRFQTFLTNDVFKKVTSYDAGDSGGSPSVVVGDRDGIHMHHHHHHQHEDMGVGVGVVMSSSKLSPQRLVTYL